MMLRNLLILVSLTAFTDLHAAAISLQFDDIPTLVMSNNQHAQGADLIKRSAEAGKGHLARSYLPKLGVTVGSERFKTGTQDSRTEPYGALTAKMNIFRSGKDLLADDLVNTKAKAASAESESTFREELKKARISFWNLVSQREITVLLEEALVENQKNLKAAQGRIKAGAATETDRIEFEMHKIELEQDLARFRLASENTERDLAVLLGLAENTNVQTPVAVGHEHRDELLGKDYNVKNNPSVNTLAFRSDEASIESLQFARWWAPSLDIYGSYELHTFREREFELQSKRYESVVGVQLTIELFDGLTSSTERRQKVLQAAGLRKESEQTARELHSKIEGAKAELKLNHELIHQSEEAASKAKSYLSRTLDEYRRGVKNSPDVLSALERNFAVRRRFAELRRDYQLARSELLAILGQ